MWEGDDGQGRPRDIRAAATSPALPGGPGVILWLSLELCVSPEPAAPVLITVQREQGKGALPSQHFPMLQQSPSHLNVNFCKDLEDGPDCLHGNAVCRNPSIPKADPNGK